MHRIERLDAVLDLIEKHNSGTSLADIGTDHAYLPVKAVERGLCTKAYACDLNEGPLEASRKAIADYHLEDKITPLPGSGLGPVADKDVDLIAICGMGGVLITDILEAHRGKAQHSVLFLQANTAIDTLRRYLSGHGFQIIDEAMVKDAGHLYEIIVATGGAQTLSEDDVTFGVYLPHRDEPLFREKWTRRLEKLQSVEASLPAGHPRHTEITKDIRRIQAVMTGE